MNCIIPGKNIKVFARAIHSLARLGEELYIEPLEKGISLKTVNSSRSAFGSFLFDPRFFDKYHRPSDNGTSFQDNENERIRCKIAMSSCLNIFKSVATIEKTVERCKISLNMQDDRLVFKMYCRHGIVKTHNLAFIECESLKAVFNSDNCENSLCAPSKMLCEAVIHFQNNQEEVTLVVSSDKISFKNYLEESDSKKQMITEVKLHLDEFNDCNIGVSTDITFCLKELRAILSFVEATNLPVKINFDTPGKPMSFHINSEGMLESTFVLATLAGDDFSNSQVPPSARQSTSQNNTRASSSSNKKMNGDNSILVEWDDMTMAEVEEMSLVEAYASRSQESTVAKTKPNSKNQLKTIPNGHNPFKTHHRPTETPESEDNNSPVIAIQPCVNLLAPNIDTDDEERQNSDNRDEEEEEEDDMIPGTPPSKKFKSLFFGSSQASDVGHKPTAVVLAADTDDEDD